MITGELCLSEKYKTQILPMKLFLLFFNIFFKFFYVYLFTLREIETVWGGAERERETENPKQALHYQHRAQCGARTHKTVRSRPELRSGA